MQFLPEETGVLIEAVYGYVMMATSKKPGLVIGIDLGTTYSCIAVFWKGKPKTIKNEHGSPTTPSWVLFSESSYWVGKAAKLNATKNAVYDSKRMLGRRFDDPILQADMKRWPFGVINVDGHPKIQVEAKKGERFSPEQISSYVLKYLTDRVKDVYGQQVTRAVVTVPAYFSHSQRKATLDAAKLAGLDPVTLLSEPLAAALAYGMENDDVPCQGNVLVFDLGGGTLDLAVVAINGGTYDVKAINGNTHLGGEDFTNNLFDHVVKEFREQGIEISQNETTSMREKCDEAKKMLSVLHEVNVTYCNDTVTVPRAKFEELNHDLLESIVEPLKQVLEDAKLKKSEINKVLLTGGSTQIPKIKEIVTTFFDGRKPDMSSDVDEVVAHGAAIEAARLDGNESVTFIRRDVTPLSIGIELFGGEMCSVVTKNSTIPLSKAHTFTTAKDNQTAVNFPVYEGERPIARDNAFLDQFKLENIPPSPRGVPQLDTIFTIDGNGILTVTATLRGTTNSKQIVIKTEGRMNAAEIADCIQQAKDMQSLDDQTRAIIAAKNELEKTIYDLRDKVKRTTAPGSFSMAIKLEEALEWIEGKDVFEKERHNKKKSDKLYTKEEYEEKQRALIRECKALGIAL